MMVHRRGTEETERTERTQLRAETLLINRFYQPDVRGTAISVISDGSVTSGFEYSRTVQEIQITEISDYLSFPLNGLAGRNATAPESGC
jgi:hypothetical protein